jgi:membrane protein YdbS with pleckstrin-like domain
VQRVPDDTGDSDLGAAMRLGAVIVVLWLLIGAFAAYQRGYFARSEVNCAEVGSVLLTVVAGPLNYAGVNPRIECEVPQPSS